MKNFTKSFYNYSRNYFSTNTFKASDLQIIKSDKFYPKPDYSKPFAWGTHHTDYILEIDHDVEKGWGKPLISPWHNLSIDPRNQTLHYGIELFEGLKAFRNSNDVYFFRPELNMQRMNRSAERVGLPAFNGEELIKLISEMIKIEKDWILDKKGYSLYIRPTFISMSDILGVQPPSKSKIFVILSPVGPYFQSGMKPISIICNEPDYIRASIGGFGSYKLGANYGPTLDLYKKAVKKGFAHILWLTNENITECGVMNFFYVIENKDGSKELLTCNLDGTILPGVIRQSVIDLAKEELKIKVTERTLPMQEFIKFHKEGKIKEAFGSGTAANIVPVGKISYQDNIFNVLPENVECGEIALKLYNLLTKIQYGEIPHKFQRKLI